ncbi:ABC transporter, permease protein [Paenibacillus sp. HGF7]|nr:ABC transporter, permease protein [Paenibacillus sp. HGF7]
MTLFRKVSLTLVMGVIAAVMVFPIGVTFVNSLMTEGEIAHNYELIGKMFDTAAGGEEGFVNLKLIPDWLSFHQYMEVLVYKPVFLQMFWNSAGLVAPIIAGQVLVASMAGYAFAKLRFWGRDKLFVVYIMTMLMPFQVTLVPNYMMAQKLGLLNTASAIILPGIFSAFGVFMLRQFMLHIPNSYIEAAQMDGAGHLRIFYKIILPLIQPGIAGLIVLLFVDNWNMVEQPLIFWRIRSSSRYLYICRVSTKEPGASLLPHPYCI